MGLSVPAALEAALQHHQAGRLPEAERDYRAILRASPNEFDALHYLGVLQAQRGHAQEAVTLIQQALGIDPQSAEANANLGNVFLETGHPAEAAKYLRKALAIEPANVESLFSLGNALRDLQQHDEALRSYDAALSINPHSFPAWNNRGDLLKGLERYQDALASFERALAIKRDEPGIFVNIAVIQRALGRHEQALASFEQALALQPNYAEAFNNRGNALLDLKRHEEALASFEQALALKPDYAEALNNRGIALTARRRDEEALASFEQALALKPDYVEALNSRGNALQELKRHEEALASFEQALALKPDYAEALNNRGNVLQCIGRLEEAIASHRQAVAIKPDYAEAHCNLGVALQDQGKLDEAIASYRKALSIKPDFADAHFNESISRLLIGDFKQGWEQYEWRWQAGHIEKKPEFKQPLWNGKYVDGTLLAWGEQGLGDQILNAGMLDDLCQRAGHLMVEVEPRLVELFRRSFPGIEVIPQGGALRASCVNVQIPMGSIAQYFRTGWSDFPTRKTGYLIADGKRTAGLRKRLTGDGRPLVGLSWRSKAKRNSQYKSARLLDFEPILKLPGIKFLDLQYGDTREERSAVRELTGIEVGRVEDIDNYQDIDGLAALIGACDAVVTISNTTAHLAGALGKSVYLLLPHSQGTIWYWHVGRDDNSWYSTARLFRQPGNGDWASVAAQVAMALHGATNG